MDKIFETFPELLKYGYIGLVVIFAIFIFLLFRKQFEDKLSTKDFLIRISPFIIVSGFLLWTSWVSIDKSYNFKQSKMIDSLSTELKIYKGTSPSTEALQRQYDVIKKKNDSLESIISNVNHHIKDRVALLDNTIMLNIVESFELATANTSGKSNAGLSDSELTFRRYKNAIFQNVYEFGADTLVLKKALEIIGKRVDDKIDIKKLISATPRIIQLRRQWVKSAFSQIQTAIDKMPQQEQDMPEIKLQYPKELWILDARPYTVTITDHDMSRLVLESELLKRK